MTNTAKVTESIRYLLDNLLNEINDAKIVHVTSFNTNITAGMLEVADPKNDALIKRLPDGKYYLNFSIEFEM